MELQVKYNQWLLLGGPKDLTHSIQWCCDSTIAARYSWIYCWSIPHCSTSTTKIIDHFVWVTSKQFYLVVLQLYSGLLLLQQVLCGTVVLQLLSNYLVLQDTNGIVDISNKKLKEELRTSLNEGLSLSEAWSEFLIS